MPCLAPQRQPKWQTPHCGAVHRVTRIASRMEAQRAGALVDRGVIWVQRTRPVRVDAQAALHRLIVGVQPGGA